MEIEELTKVVRAICYPFITLVTPWFLYKFWHAPNPDKDHTPMWEMLIFSAVFVLAFLYSLKYCVQKILFLFNKNKT
jgi:hypothetical protein